MAGGVNVISDMDKSLGWCVIIGQVAFDCFYPWDMITLKVYFELSGLGGKQMLKGKIKQAMLLYCNKMDDFQFLDIPGVDHLKPFHFRKRYIV